MKRTIKVIGEDKSKKLEITLKLTTKKGGHYNDYGDIRFTVNRDFEIYVDKIVKELMTEFHYNEIKG